MVSFYQPQPFNSGAAQENDPIRQMFERKRLEREQQTAADVKMFAELDASRAGDPQWENVDKPRMLQEYPHLRRYLPARAGLAPAAADSFKYEQTDAQRKALEQAKALPDNHPLKRSLMVFATTGKMPNGALIEEMSARDALSDPEWVKRQQIGSDLVLGAEGTQRSADNRYRTNKTAETQITTTGMEIAAEAPERKARTGLAIARTDDVRGGGARKPTQEEQVKLDAIKERIKRREAERDKLRKDQDIAGERKARKIQEQLNTIQEGINKDYQALRNWQSRFDSIGGGVAVETDEPTPQRGRAPVQMPPDEAPVKKERRYSGQSYNLNDNTISRAMLQMLGKTEADAVAEGFEVID